MNYETDLMEILENSDFESENAADSTMGTPGGAMLEGISWVYV